MFSCVGLVLVDDFCSEAGFSASTALITAWNVSPSMSLRVARAKSSFKILPAFVDMYLYG